MEIKIAVLQDGTYQYIDTGDDYLTLLRQVKDFNKPEDLLTDMSRDLQLPASKTNNKLFKHYYDVNIVDGLDARTLIPCRIEFGNTISRVGNLLIESVDMINNVADTYNVRFIGKLSEIKKKIGEDKLSDLPFSTISTFDFGAEFGSNTFDNVVLPLSSRSRRFIYNTNNLSLTDQVRQINYINTTLVDNYAIREDDLVPAIKVGHILDTIESAYGFTFAGAIREDYVENLYMYAHKVNKISDNSDILVGIADFYTRSPIPPNATSVSYSGGSDITLNTATNVTFQIRAKATLSVANRSLVLKRNGTEIQRTTTSNVFTSFIPATPGVYTAEIEGYSSGSETVTVEVQQYTNLSLDGTDSFVDSNVTIGAGASFVYSEWLNNDKVIDFLTSIIRMFNLVLVVDEDLNVSTYHFDYYYSLGTTKDVTNRIDVSKKTIGKPNFYSDLLFTTKENESAINTGFKQSFNRQYGSLQYSTDESSSNIDELAGEEYKVELKSMFIPVERLSQISNNQLTGVGYTYFGSVDGEEQKTNMVFTYLKAQNDTLAYYDGSSISSKGNYLMPVSSYQHTVGLHFGNELYEYDTEYNHVGLGLWSLFYRGVTSLMFDENKREVKMKAHLKQSDLINIELYDVLQISNNYYRITSIETNYESGESELKLVMINDIDVVHFASNTSQVRNDGSTALIVVYMNTSGVMTYDTITAGATSTINHIGELRSFSTNDYTIL